MEKAVGMTEAKSRLAELVGQAKYGGKTFVLERRGQPMAVLISVDEFERLKAAAGQPESAAGSPLPPDLAARQAELVARARRLEDHLGDPVAGLVELFGSLPPDDDGFWVEVLEAA